MKIKLKGNRHDIEAVKCPSVRNDRVLLARALLSCRETVAVALLIFKLESINRF